MQQPDPAMRARTIREIVYEALLADLARGLLPQHSHEAVCSTPLPVSLTDPARVVPHSSRRPGGRPGMGRTGRRPGYSAALTTPPYPKARREDRVAHPERTRSVARILFKPIGRLVRRDGDAGRSSSPRSRAGLLASPTLAHAHRRIGLYAGLRATVEGRTRCLRHPGQSLPIRARRSFSKAGPPGPPRSAGSKHRP